MVNLKAILEKAPEGATHYTDGTPSLNVYVKVVHLDGCYLHLAGKWERYPSYAGLKCLEDLRVMLESQAERDALAAQVEALRGVLQCFHPENFEYLPNSFDLGDDVIEALAATPQQHLAEIRAQAGRDGFIAGIQWRDKDHDDFLKFNVGIYADEYADSIRQEKKDDGNSWSMQILR